MDLLLRQHTSAYVSIRRRFRWTYCCDASQALKEAVGNALKEAVAASLKEAVGDRGGGWYVVDLLLRGVACPAAN